MRELDCPLAVAATRFPERTALVSPGGEISYGEFNRRVSQCAARLARLGIAKGDRLAIAMPTSVDYVVLLLALMRRGAVACPLSTRMPNEKIAAAAARVSSPRVVLPPGETLTGLSVLHPGEVLGDDEEAIEPVRPIDADQWATVIFTSGSSGEPKAAVHAYGNHYFSAEASNRNMPVGPGDCWLLSLPLYHVAGLGILFRCLLGGGAAAVPSEGEAIGEAIRRYAVTHVSLVSTQLYRLLQDEGAAQAVAGLKAVLLGGSAFPAEIIRLAVKRGVPVSTSYGLTETATQIAATRPGEGVAASQTSGRPLTAGTVSISEAGEILVRGATLFKGYLEGEELSLRLTRGGWFATGDLGSVDALGYLHVAGRRDNLFISGGENIQPEEVEGALCRQPGILDALVVPVEDEEFGQRPVAFVRIVAGKAVDFEGMLTELGKELPRFKIPAEIHPWPKEYEAPDMKVDRDEFQAMAKRRSQ